MISRRIRKMHIRHDQKKYDAVFDRTERRLLLILAILLIAASVVMVCLLAVRRTQSAAFTPPPFETGFIESIPEDWKEKNGYREFDIAGKYTVSLCGLIEVRDGRAMVCFSSDMRNTVWTRILLLDERGRQLGESGMLLPGQAIGEIALREQPAESMDVVIKVLSYEPDTYYSHGSASISGKLLVYEQPSVQD